MAEVFAKVKEQRFSHHSSPFLASSIKVSDCLSLQPFWPTPSDSLSASSPNTVLCTEYLIVKGERKGASFGCLFGVLFCLGFFYNLED